MIATQTRRARIYGIIWGDANVNKHDGKRSGMFKTVQNSKTEGGIERRRKHKNVNRKEEDVPGAILPLEKNHREECYRSLTLN